MKLKNLIRLKSVAAHSVCICFLVLAIHQPAHAQAPNGSSIEALQSGVNAANAASTQAKRDHEVLQAWFEYSSNTNEGNRTKLLNTLRNAGYTPGPPPLQLGTPTTPAPNEENMKIIELNGYLNQYLSNNSLPPEIKTKIQEHDRNDRLLRPPDTRTLTDTDKEIVSTTLGESKKIVDQKSLEASYHQRNLNSEKIVQEHAGQAGAEAANAIRRLQDLQDWKRLGCDSDPPKVDSNICREIVDRSFENRNYATALAAAQKKVNDIESELQQALKKNLAEQQVQVSNILAFKGREGEALQTTYVGGPQGGLVFFISRIIDTLVLVVSSLAVVTFIIGGYMYMYSAGDEQRRENGKDVLKYTLLGLFFVYASYAIVRLIQGLFYT